MDGRSVTHRRRRKDEAAYFVLERHAQTTRVEIPDTHFAICRAGYDRVCGGRPNSCCARAINGGGDDVDEGNGFYALAFGVAAQG